MTEVIDAEEQLTAARQRYRAAVQKAGLDPVGIFSTCEWISRSTGEMWRREGFEAGQRAARKDDNPPAEGRRVIPAPPEPRTQVHNPVVVAPLDLPNADELRALRDLCARTYGAWCSSEGFVSGYMRHDPSYKKACDAEWLTQLKRAIGAISQLHVLERPNPRLAVSAHFDGVSQVLRRISMHGECRSGPLVLGCFLMRVPVAGFAMDGHTPSLGLDEFLGKPADPSAWRTTLREGKLPQQHAAGGRRIESTPSPVRIQIGGY